MASAQVGKEVVESNLYDTYCAAQLFTTKDIGGEQCDQKKSPNVNKSCPKMISLEKWKILTPLQKLPKNVGDLGKLIVAKGLKKLPKMQ